MPTGSVAPDDAALVRRAREGDLDAYERLVRLHQDTARRVAFMICGHTTDFDDAVQDAFVKAWHALPGVHEGAPFRPWLLRIVANESRNRARSAGRRGTLALRFAAQENALSMPSVEELVVAGEAAGDVRRALAQLNARDREIITCRYFLGLSELETADTLGCARGTVKSRLSRALQHLRVALKPADDLAGVAPVAPVGPAVAERA